MILLSGFYREADAGRRAEFQECLRRNIENNQLDLIAHGRRVTYRDFFDYANSRLSRRRVIIANADIYFDETLKWLDGVDLAGKLLCLSRGGAQPE